MTSWRHPSLNHHSHHIPPYGGNWGNQPLSLNPNPLYRRHQGNPLKSSLRHYPFRFKPQMEPELRPPLKALPACQKYPSPKKHRRKHQCQQNIAVLYELSNDLCELIHHYREVFPQLGWQAFIESQQQGGVINSLPNFHGQSIWFIVNLYKKHIVPVKFYVSLQPVSKIKDTLCQGHWFHA